MQLSLDSNQTGYIIQAYSEQAITINGIVYLDSIIVSPTELVTAWQANSWQALNVELLQPILALSPETILIGTGVVQHFLPFELLKIAQQRGIGIEVMNTSAACRTYNILCSEGRKVVAGLLLH